MKKIFNWTIGSFLRTISRIIAYLFVGFILAIICSKVGINFGYVVNASSIDVADAKFNLYTAITRDNCNLATSYGYKKLNSSTDITEKPFINKVHYLISSNLKANQSYTLSFIQSYNPKSSVLQTINTLVYRMEAGTTDSNLSSNNISSFKCFATNDKTNNFRINVTCNFVPLTDIKKLWIEQLHPNCGTTANYFNTYTLKINSNSSTEESINNQTEIIIDKSDKIIEGQDKINDTINNSDTTEANRDANSFFDNFDSGDTGSLMNLVKLPLKFLNKLNNSCAPVQINTGYLGKWTLPCLSSYLYNVSSFAPIFNIISLVLNGAIMYGCIKSIIIAVHKLKDPNDDEIEVLDL